MSEVTAMRTRRAGVDGVQLASLIVIVIGGFCGRCWRAHKPVRADPVPGRAIDHLGAPKWEVGDWFVIATSSWGSGYVAAVWSRPLEELPWGAEEFERIDVAREEPLFGHECLVLDLRHWISTDLPSAPYCHVWMRNSDRATLKLDLVFSSEDAQHATFLQAPAPLCSTLNTIAFPVFPMVPELRTYPRTGLRWPDGRKVNMNEKDLSFGGPVEQQSKAEAASSPSALPTVVRTTIVGHSMFGDLDDVAVVRWVVGDLWWMQTWTGRGLPAGRARYRASLRATSRDVLSASETKRVLPNKLNGWRVEVVPVDLPEPTRHVLTEYHRAQAATYSHDGRPELVLWVLPKQFDEDCTSKYAALSAKQRRDLGLPEPVGEGSNYRVVAAHIRGQEARELIVQIRDNIRCTPVLEVPQGYPLPKAAPGGRILEPEIN